jgi:hypothetical protein
MSITSGVTPLLTRALGTSSALMKLAVVTSQAFSTRALSALNTSTTIKNGYVLVGRVLSAANGRVNSSVSGTTFLSALVNSTAHIQSPIRVLMPIYGGSLYLYKAGIRAAANLLGKTFYSFVSNNSTFIKAGLSANAKSLGSSNNRPLYSTFMYIQSFFKNSGNFYILRKTILYGSVSSISTVTPYLNSTYRAITGIILSISRIHAPMRLGNFFDIVVRSKFSLFGKGPVYKTAQLHSNVLTLTKTSSAPNYNLKMKTLARSASIARSTVSGFSGLVGRIATNLNGPSLGVRQLLNASALLVSSIKNRINMYFTNPNYIDYKSTWKNPWNTVVFGLEMQLTPKDPSETVIVTFDFSSVLASGEALESIVSVSSVVFYGTDTNPSAMITTTPLIINATQMVQPVSGGIDQNTYKIKATVNTTLNQILTSTAILPVVAQ